MGDTESWRWKVSTNKKQIVYIIHQFRNLTYTWQHGCIKWSKIGIRLKANWELLVFLLMVSVFSTTLSLSALSVFCNHTQNESSATLNALFLARSHAVLALVLQLNKPQLNFVSATLILWVCTRWPPLSGTWGDEQHIRVRRLLWIDTKTSTQWQNERLL